MYVRFMIECPAADADATDAFADVVAALTRASACEVAALSPRQIAAALESLQLVRNALPAAEHRLLAALESQTTSTGRVRWFV